MNDETNYQKLDLKSKDIIIDNINYIAARFPNSVKEGKIDFEALKQDLSDEIIDIKKEKYQLTWAGKVKSVKEANTQTNKTIRPVQEKSVYYNNTRNIYIEGDNLEALKILQESYLNKIKLIYIDPPYNTGSDFVYNDNFKKNENEELSESGQIDEYNNKLISNNDSNGRFHSDWLNMMFSRIKLARNLLSEDGFIFISIDDHEVNNLAKICDEIFGERNKIAQLVWKKKYTGGKGTNTFADYHEYILVYCKNNDSIEDISMARPESEKEKFNLKDEFYNERGGYYIRPLKSNLDPRPTLVYPIELPDGNKVTTQWICAENTFLELKKEGRIVFKDLATSKYPVYKKFYEKDAGGNVKIPSFLEISSNNEAKEELKDLFDVEQTRDLPFQTPKPTKLLRVFIDNFTKENDIVLDFFAGSSSTADALLRANAEDSHNRKYIMIQIPEKCDENGLKLGFNTICDLGEERIRRAANKIKKETNADIDYGFRVYKVDSSNMKDIYYEPSKLNQAQLNMFESNIKEDRTSEDLLTQVILDLGLTLDLRIEEKNLLNNKVYFVEENSLVACFDNQINIDILNQICEIKPLKVVFRESSFKNDSDKINAYERIKKLSPETEISVI